MGGLLGVENSKKDLKISGYLNKTTLGKGEVILMGFMQIFRDI